MNLYYMHKKGIGQVYAYSLRARTLKEARKKAGDFYGSLTKVEVWLGEEHEERRRTHDSARMFHIRRH